MNNFKLIQGSPGRFNDWTPVPTLNEHAGIEESGPQDFPPYQLFDIDGNVIPLYSQCRRQEALKHVLTCRLSLGAHWGRTTTFIINILCDHCLHDSGLYIQKIFTKREMVNFQKLVKAIISVATGARELNGN